MQTAQQDNSAAQRDQYDLNGGATLSDQVVPDNPSSRSLSYHDPVTGKLTSKGTLFLVATYGMTFIAAFNENIINVALLDISNTFAISADIAQWLVTGYMIVASIITASTGFFSQRFSTRGLFFATALSLACGEVLCLVSPNFTMMLVFRLAQAVGSGLIFPLMMNSAMTVAPRSRLGFFMAIGSACTAMGPAFGPVVSGAATTMFGWRAIFVFPAVMAVVFGLIGARAVDNLRDTDKVKVDILSVGLLALGIFLFVNGMNNFLADPLVAAMCVACSLLILGLFARRQLVLPVPLVDLRPLKRTSFWPAVVLVMIGMIASFSMSVILPIYFEGAFEVTALLAGALIIPCLVLNAFTDILGGRIMDKHGEWPLLPCGFLIMAIGLVAMAITSSNLETGLVTTTLLAVVVFGGIGAVFPTSQAASLRLLPQDEEFAGTALANTLVMIAASIGSALSVGIFTATSGAATAQGAAQTVAAAQGFSMAIWAIAILVIAAMIIAAVYTRMMRKRA